LDTDEIGMLDTVSNVFADAFASSLTFTGAAGPLAYSFLPVADGTQVLKDDGSNLTSEGANVLFALSGGVLIGYVNVGASGYVPGIDRDVFTVQLNQPAAEQYIFTLLDNLDHQPADNVEDFIGIDLDNRVGVTDTGDPRPLPDTAPIADFTVNVIDDIPVAEANSRTVQEGTLLTVDVQLIVDISGSMNESVGNVPDFSNNRIGLARYALREFLNDNIQVQNVQFVKFSDRASNTVWMTRDQALAHIEKDSNWTVGGTTNYDAALNQAMGAFGSPRPLPVSDSTYIYFVSDGVPNPTTAGIGVPGNPIPPDVSTEQWETFVTTPANDISEVFALGIGPGARSGPLEPVAFPNDDADGNGLEDNVILLPTDDVDPLLDTLNDAIGPPSSISGNILIDDPSSTTGEDGFGADGGFIRSITVDGTTYTFDGVGTITPSGNPPPAGFVNNGTSMTVPTALGGTLTFFFASTALNAAGDWSYLTGSGADSDGLEQFPYVLVDGDQDVTASTLDITVTPQGLRSARATLRTQIDATGDFDGDGDSDVLLHSDDGSVRTLRILEMEGCNVAAVHLAGAVGADLRVAGAGDFDRDGDDDILLDSVAGDVRTVVALEMNDNTVQAAHVLGQIGSDWLIDGLGDFDGDGDRDLLFHRDEGAVRTLLNVEIEGNTVVAAHVLGNVGTAVSEDSPSHDVVVEGIGDFDASGDDDILLSSVTGDVRTLVVVEMNNDTVQAGHVIGQLGSDWQVDGLGDFDRDGDRDILIHRVTGDVKDFMILEMNANTVQAAHALGQVGNDWQVAGIGDFGRDGDSDIAIHRDVGTATETLIVDVENNRVAAGLSVVGVPPNWDLF
jgi:von Willebrand factor type A domain